MKSLLFLAKTAIQVTAFLLALACAFGALAAQGGRFSDRLDVLTHFAPLWLAGGLLAGALWVVFVRREDGFFTVVLAALAVLSSASLMAPEMLAADKFHATPVEGRVLKIVQLNVWGRNDQPEKTVDWIVAQKPDVVVVEEVVDLDQGVNRLLKDRFAYRTTCSAPLAGCTTMIFYNRPPLAQGGVLRPRDKPQLPAAWVTLPSPAGPFTVVGVHLTWPYPAGVQQAQARRLAGLLDRFDRASTIVAGDFNSTPWSFAARRRDKALKLERRTRALFTWPASEFTRWRLTSPLPFLAIDHVYAGTEWRTVEVKRGPRLGSDHYPVVVTLERVSPR